MTPGVVIVTRRVAVTQGVVIVTWGVAVTPGIVISRYEVNHGTEHLILW